jgi:hypothetical protein
MLWCTASTRSVTPTEASKASRMTPRRSERRRGDLEIMAGGPLEMVAFYSFLTSSTLSISSATKYALHTI